jgi:hypothetical protein
MVAGDYAWVLSNLRRIDRPFPVKGQLNFYKVAVPADAV